MTLEARMESCRQKVLRGIEPRVATAGRRRNEWWVRRVSSARSSATASPPTASTSTRAISDLANLIDATLEPGSPNQNHSRNETATRSVAVPADPPAGSPFRVRRLHMSRAHGATVAATFPALDETGAVSYVQTRYLHPPGRPQVRQPRRRARHQPPPRLDPHSQRLPRSIDGFDRRPPLTPRLETLYDWAARDLCLPSSSISSQTKHRATPGIRPTRQPWAPTPTRFVRFVLRAVPARTGSRT